MSVEVRVGDKHLVTVKFPSQRSTESSVRATDPRPFRPKRGCTYRGTSRPGGPRSARFTARTLSAFRATSTGGTSFTLGETEGWDEKTGAADLSRTSNSSGPAVGVRQKLSQPCASTLHASTRGHLTELAGLVASSPCLLLHLPWNL